MPSTTTFRSGKEFRLFVRDDLPASDFGAAPASALPPKLLPPKFWRRVRRFAKSRSNMAVKAVAICLTSLTVAGLLAQWRAASPVREAPPSPAPVWLDIARPSRLYDLSAPQLAHEKFTYAARRHSTGGGREDLLTFGEFAAKKWFLRLSVYRHGEEKTADAPFFVDMARRAAPLGLSLDHVKLERSEKTRFGDLETADMTLSENSFSRGNCRGFRLVRAAPGLTLSGLACAPGAEPLSAPDLICLIDRLDLSTAGDDRPLRDFFAEAQARRMRSCGEITRGR
ncbi:hypothetical protein [uncultured Rhodoblastus sp.]|uniref:hypothetical protein n=1 Tax=uncultured Rhodoblastus sp. TaxID=543037 RepID=UPI0025EA991E|nr:hypothetical protein [uncultured Rhodoblastus sp.]